MSTSVARGFQASGLVAEGVVPWGARPQTSESGIYVVSLTSSISDVDSCLDSSPLSAARFQEWLARCPEMTLDGTTPTVEQLMERVRRFWIADEAILYVGLATNLSSRLGQYYNTPIGARRPHSGGYFLKLLSNLDDLFVHYARCTDPRQAEHKVLGAFCAAMSPASQSRLHDPAHPFPFANLEWPHGIRKAHGLRGAREKDQSGDMDAKSVVAKPAVAAPRGQADTQRVTGRDWRNGQIRIPVASKCLFPRETAVMEIRLRGEAMQASWNPRTGEGQSRSGVLGVGRECLQRLVREGEILSIFAKAGGITLA